MENIRSELFRLGMSDVMRGLVMAVLSAALTVVYQAVQANTGVNWMDVLHVAEAAGIGYMIKNFLSDGQGKVFGAIG